MDTLSYLIEHNNQVRIDERLVKEYERDNDQGTLRRLKKSNEKMDKPPSPQPLGRPRPLKTYTRVSPGNSSNGGTTSHSPKLNRPITRNNIQRPLRSEQAIPATINQLSDRELITVLTNRIESLRENQVQAEAKYNESIQQLKSQLNRCNMEYDQQCQEFDRIRSEIVSTKKDIASLIGLVQKGKNTGLSEEGPSDREHQARPPQNKTQTGVGSPRSILNNFIKVGPGNRQ